MATAVMQEVKKSIRVLKGATHWVGKMDHADREYLAARLLNTTQDALHRAGFCSGKGTSSL